MRKGGGRLKGNAFENQVAKRIVRAFRKLGIKRVDCYRTPSSGGHRFAKKEDPGDLVISKMLLKMFPFVVECKAYRKINWWRFFVEESRWKRSWIERKWLQQVIAATEKRQGGREENSERFNPLLVMKENNAPWMVMVEASTYAAIVIREGGRTYVDMEGIAWRLLPFEHFLGGVVEAAIRNRRGGRVV